MDKYALFKLGTRWESDLFRMLEHFFGREYYSKYVSMLWRDILGRVRYGRSVIKDVTLPKCYQYRNIPWFMWPVFAGYVLYRIGWKIIKIVTPKKIMAWIRQKY